MICVFRVYGRRFAVDAFLVDSPWRSRAEIHRKGDPIESRVLQRRLKLTREVESGFQMAIGSEGPDGDIDSQVEQTIRFLRRYGKEIARLSLFKVEHKALHFGVIRGKNIAVKTHCLPSALLKFAGELAVDIQVTDYGYVASSQSE